jgi:hypothetical protein
MNPEEKSIEIDLGVVRNETLNESFLEMFGTAIKMTLERMFGRNTSSILVRGTKSEVNSFANVLSKEKSYIETAQKYGLDKPQTYKSKAKLDTAAQKFERDTGLKWPFK